MSPELPGLRAQASPAKEQEDLGTRMMLIKIKRLVQPRSQELSPTRLSLHRDGSVENPGNDVDISCILALKRYFSNVAYI